MKAIFTSIVLTLVLSYSGSAQQGGGARNMRQQMSPEEIAQMHATTANRQTEQMKERLKLDAEQEKAIGEINLKYVTLRTQLMQLARTQEGADIPALMAELDELRDNEILPFLNSDQVEPYFALKKEQQEQQDQRMQRMMQQGGGGQQRGVGGPPQQQQQRGGERPQRRTTNE